MLGQAKLVEPGDCAEIAVPFVMSREARDEGADDMDTDGVSLSASDRDGDDGAAGSAEQQSEALGRGRRNLARSRSRGESDDEADLGALLPSLRLLLSSFLSSQLSAPFRCLTSECIWVIQTPCD